jgi:hypothetical protein
MKTTNKTTESWTYTIKFDEIETIRVEQTVRYWFTLSGDHRYLENGQYALVKRENKDDCFTDVDGHEVDVREAVHLETLNLKISDWDD